MVLGWHAKNAGAGQLYTDALYGDGIDRNTHCAWLECLDGPLIRRDPSTKPVGSLNAYAPPASSLDCVQG